MMNKADAMRLQSRLSGERRTRVERLGREAVRQFVEKEERSLDEVALEALEHDRAASDGRGGVALAPDLAYG